MKPISKSQAKRIFAQVGGDWQLYEFLKQEWIKANPEAKPEEYSKAMRELANKAGV